MSNGCKRMTDGLPFRITRNMLYSFIAALLLIIGWFVRGWYAEVNMKLDTYAQACDNIDNRVIPLELIIPKIEKTMDRLEWKLDKHIGGNR